MVGDKYGSPVAPYRIGKEEFEALKTVAEENHIAKGYLLDEWYEKDENTIPSLYTLQVHGQIYRKTDYTIIHHTNWMTSLENIGF